MVRGESSHGILRECAPLRQETLAVTGQRRREGHLQRIPDAGRVSRVPACRESAGTANSGFRPPLPRPGDGAVADSRKPLQLRTAGLA